MSRFIRNFLAKEAAPGIVVLAVTVFALVVANSPLADLHRRLFTPGINHAIDAGPMALFFLVVSLEIKRELAVGELSRWSQAALPVVAAGGGMVVPALIFLAVNLGQPANFPGWGIPTATDIAFSLAVLTLANGRIPPSLRVFLASLAIIDDLGAILIISLFYTGTLVWPMLGLAGAGVLALVAFNRFRAPLWLYGVVGAALWLCLLHSGVHATLAGVAVGLAVPADRTRAVERWLGPVVNFLIVPLFVFANAGIDLSDVSAAMLGDELFLGIAAGLFFGKQAGVMAASWLLLRLSPARLPAGANWPLFHATAVLTGIGFTMSLFIGELAFPGGNAEIRLGVLTASLVSALVGLLLLFRHARRQNGSSTA